MDLDVLHTEEGYRLHFMNLALWEPYVRQVCGRHLATPAGLVRPGLAGTYPTFIVDERWVVKFFGRLFDGELGFQTELQVGRLLEADPAIPAPSVLASGRLSEDPSVWPWPYLIYAFVPGVSFGEVHRQVEVKGRLALARQLGSVVRRIHQLPLAGAELFQPDWSAYLEFLRAQRAHCAENHRAWGTLPLRLVDQIDRFLVPVSDLLELDCPPHLIHADITGDHLLGRLEGGRWITHGLIDFGDAMVGDLFYELVALHLDLFRCNKRLLRAFLDSYHPGPAFLQDFARRAMTVTLLHRFDVSVCLRSWVEDIATLDELAVLLWDLNAPGIA